MCSVHRGFYGPWCAPTTTNRSEFRRQPMKQAIATAESILSRGQSQQFQSDGFVVLPGFLAASEVEVVLRNLQRFIDDRVPSMPREHVFYEDVRRPDTLKQLQSLFTYDDYFAGLFFNSRFERLAMELLQDEVVGKNMQYFNKPPQVGQPTPPHQDGYYFMLDPCEALTMWLALDVVDEENGCIRYVHGSHRRGMRPHSRTQTLGFSQGISNYPQPDDIANDVAIRARPGDLVVHHAMTIHRADGNRSSERSRRAIGFIYYAKRR